jgi:dihydropteroate synthase
VRPATPHATGSHLGVPGPSGHPWCVDLFGVVNASPDSLHRDSMVATPEEAVARGRALLEDGAVALDLGGQGTTYAAEEVAEEQEWTRLAPLVPALAGLGVPLSIDTYRPSVARRALEAGATWLNAADGLQSDELARVAADGGCPVVLPFLNGPTPHTLAPVDGADPTGVLVEWFDATLRRLDAFGLRRRCVLDPGTGFAPHDLPWEERFVFQKRVYSELDRLRTFDLPLYIALPWRDTPQHAELLDIVLAADPEYGRAHEPARIVAAARRLRTR